MWLRLRQIYKELMTEKTRIFLTILAIAWGTFAIASMLAIGEGLRQTFAEAVANVGSNLLTVNGGQTSKPFHGFPANQPIKLTQKDLRDIRRGIPNIISISPQYDTNKNLQSGEINISAPIQAVGPEFAKIHDIDIENGGRFINTLDNQKRNAVIVLGTDTFQQFFKEDENPIGKFVLVNQKPFQIIGVMQDKSQIIASEAPDSYYNWIPSRTYELMANPQVIDSFSITYQDPNLLDSTKQQIQKIIALNHGADPNDDNILDFSEFEKQQETVNNFFFGMQIFLGIIGTLTLLVAGVGIANVMFASVKRATHEIGIRIAIGARTYQVIWHYIAEAMMTTFIGGIFGVLATSLLVFGLKSIPMKGRLIEAIGRPQPMLSFSVLLMVALILGITGFLAGLFPALQASKIDPSEALRYE